MTWITIALAEIVLLCWMVSCGGGGGNGGAKVSDTATWPVGPPLSSLEQAWFDRAKQKIGEELGMTISAYTPFVRYVPPEPCGGNYDPCCTRDCLPTKAQSCYLVYEDGSPSNTVVITSNEAFGEGCYSVDYKLKIEMCNAVAYQWGIYQDQYNQPCGLEA